VHRGVVDDLRPLVREQLAVTAMRGNEAFGHGETFNARDSRDQRDARDNGDTPYLQAVPRTSPKLLLPPVSLSSLLSLKSLWSLVSLSSLLRSALRPVAEILPGPGILAPVFLHPDEKA
jgi:hypothetical protein